MYDLSGLDKGFPEELNKQYPQLILKVVPDTMLLKMDLDTATNFSQYDFGFGLDNNKQTTTTRNRMYESLRLFYFYQELTLNTHSIPREHCLPFMCRMRILDVTVEDDFLNNPNPTSLPNNFNELTATINKFSWLGMLVFYACFRFLKNSSKETEETEKAVNYIIKFIKMSDSSQPKRTIFYQLGDQIKVKET
jgi:hypothetical protein